MSTTILTIGQRAPIIEQDNYPGLKTVFIAPQKNWPAPAGQQYPIVPADIEITIRNRIGAIYSEDIIDLPALGFCAEYQGDGISVFAYYSPKQGLGTPYTTYIINAGLFKGPKPLQPSRFFHRTDFVNSFDVYYPATDRIDIPSFSSKLSAESNCHGRVILTPPNATDSLEYYDFQSVQRPITFGPDKTQFALWIVCPSYGPALVDGMTTSIEFS